ncbi:UNVERIFIED_CONTAM: hypothetical protein PYX00_005889 [Menopon gallinae]|uniref:E3 ubiquitin-protein ligase n=1 Tax=Menopon gallinae TaxID=328185 RepID=A0AAW2HV62_9NEOP
MAESMPEKDVGNDMTSSATEFLECAVCLQGCVHPAELPCGHVFCYLCIKGIVNRGSRCAMCRQDIPSDYLDNPRLLKPIEVDLASKAFEDGHSWFYEGQNGWWQYDERTSSDLETAYQKGDRTCELLVAGYLYVADFDKMLQYRRSDSCKRRRIKRDIASTNKKGVAGLKFVKDSTSSTSSDASSNASTPVVQNPHIPNRPPEVVIPQRSEVPRSHSVTAQTVPLPSQEQGRNNGVSPRVSERSPRDGRSRRNYYHAIRNQVAENIHNQLQGELDYDMYGIDELDDTIRHTLDWTIRQIETLQLELSNDYDNLSEEVDQYETLQNFVTVLGRRTGQMAGARSHTPDTRLNRSLENELNPADRITRSLLNLSEEDIFYLQNRRFV